MGHHFDDQAETLFANGKNSALDGLSGMNEISSWNGIYILRPFFYITKIIFKITQKIKIQYFEDSSNFNVNLKEKNKIILK